MSLKQPLQNVKCKFRTSLFVPCNSQVQSVLASFTVFFSITIYNNCNFKQILYKAQETTAVKIKTYLRTSHSSRLPSFHLLKRTYNFF